MPRSPASALTALLALVAAAGCAEAPVEFHRPTDPAPSGLPATLASLTSLPQGPGADVTAAGDSVVVVAALSASGCADKRVLAGTDRGALVVTYVDSATNRACTLDLRIVNYRAVVRPAPRGRYDVVVRSRSVGTTNGPFEYLLGGRRGVSLP